MPELFCGFAQVFGQAHPLSRGLLAPGVVRRRRVPAGDRHARPSPDAIENRLTLDRPRLPPWLRWLELRGLRVGKSRIDLRVIQGRENAAVELVARDGDAEVVVRR